MKLAELSERGAPVPWQDGGKIPWNDSAFSARMLREHLAQQHDRASRRFATIDRHVAWLHAHVLGKRAARVLDPGCGPGLYTQRLAALGHAGVGIDFSPASIAHARAEAERERLACRCRSGRRASAGTVACSTVPASRGSSGTSRWILQSAQPGDGLVVFVGRVGG